MKEKETKITGTKTITVNGYRVNLIFTEYNPKLASTIKDMLLETVVNRINGMEN